MWRRKWAAKLEAGLPHWNAPPSLRVFESRTRSKYSSKTVYEASKVVLHRLVPTKRIVFVLGAQPHHIPSGVLAACMPSPA